MLPYLEGINNVDVYEYGKWYSYGEFNVAIGKSYHDVENCFYRLDFNGYKIFRATDTFTLDGITAKDYSLFCLEANYTEETVYDIIREKQERGEYAHQIGAINSHLSFEQANDFFYKNKGEHSVMVRLHESKTF